MNDRAIGGGSSLAGTREFGMGNTNDFGRNYAFLGGTNSNQNSNSFLSSGEQ